MDPIVIMCIILSLALVFTLIANAGHRSTLRSKESYEQMVELMEGERRMIKEDRVTIKQENTKCKKELDRLIVQSRDHNININKALLQFDALAGRYIQKRIELLQLKRPDLQDSPSALYKLQDLLNKKKNGHIDALVYLNEVDNVFDKLSNGTYK